MHLPRIRPRFTVRRLMVAVAIAGLLMGASRWIVEMRARSAYYEGRAYYSARIDGHRMNCIVLVTTKDGRIGTSDEDESFWLRKEWCYTLSNKYWRLCNRPWLPVEPDPPPPVQYSPLYRSAADCPAEYRLRDQECDWLRDPSESHYIHPWWTFLWTWNKWTLIYGNRHPAP